MTEAAAETSLEQPDNTIPWEDEEPAQPEPAAAEPAPGAPGAPPEPLGVTKVAREEPPAPPPRLPEPAAGGAPPWAIIPKGLKVPRGRAVFFARFPSTWTDTPRDGVPGELDDAEAAAFKAAGAQVPTLFRQCIFWALSLGDQAVALGRANGDANRWNSELAKQMIRAVDGHLADRSGTFGPGDVDLWWERIGERCRRELTQMCVRIHSLTAAERALFFGHCVASRTAG